MPCKVRGGVGATIALKASADGGFRQIQKPANFYSHPVAQFHPEPPIPEPADFALSHRHRPD
ncbi:hypothetical protein [Lyngbya sp. CCY1209]|uniref:hypothetical protein n=1 Tax=Lyngbya sp. CCY1209 TaxID=2886103 RepID=UPI002D20BC87|nr:hypothetical protein [Lyngbya sp. CCY1209]MEB3885923.1 hypothetical protein [Lyngbya sp. CCY1209]